MWVEQEQLGQAAHLGVNIVHPFAGLWSDLEFCETYLEQADAVGLQVVMDLLPCQAYGGGVWNETVCGHYISTLATHDNLIAWFLPDEINDVELAGRLYEWVQRYDPHQRPIYVNPGVFDLETIQRFPAVSDFLWGAWYPEYDQAPRAEVTYGTQLNALAAQGTSDRWGTIVQFFDNASVGQDSGYPTPAELRSDSYQSIIAGATGLWYYSYVNGHDLPDLLPAIETITGEIIGAGGLDEVILAPAVPQTITQTVLAGPTHSPPVPVQGQPTYEAIQTLQKEHGATYLFAVNIATDEVTVQFGNLAADLIEAHVLFEDRTIPISNGSFRDTFAPDAVHIYFLRQKGAPPPVRAYVYLPVILKE